MSTLLLVRHGQARAFDADSDRLSELGAEQARRLGEHWIASGVELDEIHVGTLTRQRQTAELVAEVFAKAGRGWPEPRANAAWNEYDSGGILGRLMPALAASDEAFAKLVTDFQAAAARPDRNRYFQRMFETLMDRWEEGALAQDGVEPFAAFHERVRAAFRMVTSQGGSRRVAVFTSGGPIGVCTQVVLDAPPRAALRLNWRVRNASLTEMIFSEGRTSLESFNVDHYLESRLRSFR
jgi:broad specificity phosphatase PhoE